MRGKTGRGVNKGQRNEQNEERLGNSAEAKWAISGRSDLACYEFLAQDRQQQHTASHSKHAVSLSITAGNNSALTTSYFCHKSHSKPTNV